MRSHPSTDPVRLALDVGPLHGHRTGVGAAVAALVDALAQHPDVAVTPYLLSYRTRPPPPVRRLPLPAALAHRLWARIDRPRLDRWLGDVDVVHGTNYVVPPSRRPRLVSVYDCWFLTHPDRASPTVRRVGAILRRAVASGATVHASSAATAHVVRGLLTTDRVEVVHLGPLPVAPPGSPPPGLDGGPFVLALGTVERRKNLPHLVAAFATADVDDTELVIAGADGDDSGALTVAVDDLTPERRQRIRRLGPVDAGTKSWLLHHAAALAYPSLDEGFGFPVLEAQSVGVPVVATVAGSIPEVAGAGAELVPLDDVDALAGALHRVVDDDARRRQLIAAGTTNLERFSWSSTADQLVALYRKLDDA